MATSFLASIPTTGNREDICGPGRLQHYCWVYLCMCLSEMSHPVNHQPSQLPNQHLIYESQYCTSIFNLTREVAGPAPQHKDIKINWYSKDDMNSAPQLEEKSHSLLWSVCVCIQSTGCCKSNRFKLQFSTCMFSQEWIRRTLERDTQTDSGKATRECDLCTKCVKWKDLWLFNHESFSSIGLARPISRY